MAHAYADRVKETTTTTGTGTVSLAGAETGFQTFVAGAGTGSEVYYSIVHQTANEWEVGKGTVTDATPDTLSRTTILSSSNSGSAVTFSSGTKDVFLTLPAVEAGNNSNMGLFEHAATIGSDYTIETGNNAVSAGDITINSGVTVTVPSGSNWVIV